MTLFFADYAFFLQVTFIANQNHWNLEREGAKPRDVSKLTYNTHCPSNAIPRKGTRGGGNKNKITQPCIKKKTNRKIRNLAELTS